MSDSQSAPRSARTVLTEALAELRDRETRLARFVGELAETRAAIKAIEKQVGSAPKATASEPAQQTGETSERVVKLVGASLEPLTRDQIADLLGREPGGWLSMLLKKLVAAKQLIEVSEGRYGVPSPLAVVAA